jgi:glycerol uptake facilitator-like aquaporin
MAARWRVGILGFLSLQPIYSKHGARCGSSAPTPHGCPRRAGASPGQPSSNRHLALDRQSTGRWVAIDARKDQTAMETMDPMARDRLARYAAEAIGTGFLVATVVGSGIMATRLTSDPGLQLLANALPTGAILVVLITIFGPVSGAHFNPAVSLVFAIRRALAWRELAPYVGAQCLGGIVGTAVAHLMFGLAPLMIGTTARALPSLWFSEVVATFTLVIAILGTLRARPEAVPWIVGLTITAAYWFTASTSFANPAVTLARGFTTSFAGIALVHVPMFVLMQGIGALAAMSVARVIFAQDET